MSVPANYKTAEANLEVSKASIAQAAADLKTAETNLDYCTIRAPVKGVVIDRRVNIGQTVVEQLKSDLDLEHHALKVLKDGIETCRKATDRTSEELLVKILEAEEGHIDWLETQLQLIEQIGEKHYLSQKLG